jgi:hypothetical protein
MQIFLIFGSIPNQPHHVAVAQERGIGYISIGDSKVLPFWGILCKTEKVLVQTQPVTPIASNTMRYRVERHGGRADNSWRPILNTDDRQEAEKKYQEYYLKIRQGGLRLVEKLAGDKQRVVKEYSAPRIRSRW